jgi:hypothetical protein
MRSESDAQNRSAAIVFAYAGAVTTATAALGPDDWKPDTACDAAASQF